jgi:peptidoglycan glycosyltransferase
MAMVVAAIANGGEMMEPNLVHEVVNHEGDVLERFGPDVWRRVVPEESAAMVRELLLASADYGYASAAKIDGVTVGAKTGTAEVGDGEPHAWFTAFAEDGERSLVVSVVVENGGAGSATALPIGRQLLEAALADGAQP